MSGVEVTEDLKKLFTLVKEKKDHQGFVIAMGKEMEWTVVETMPRVTGKAGKHIQKDKEELREPYEAFLEKHLKDEPVFLLLDFTTIEGCKKVLGIQWCPDSCAVKKKMIFSSSLKPIKGEVEQWVKVIQTCDKDDVTFNCLLGNAQQ